MTVRNCWIVPMTRAHAAASGKIVAASDPWKTLGEGVDFSPAIRSGQAFVYLIDNVVAGFVVFTPEPVFARGGYLRAIAVAPALTGQGIGGELLDFAERMTAKKAPNLFLCVSSFNKAGQAFYRKSGYRKVGRLDGLIRKGASEYIYWKKLR
jgi:ribosomal protein S18 acetylase RimI-like enzyme